MFFIAFFHKINACIKKGLLNLFQQALFVMCLIVYQNNLLGYSPASTNAWILSTTPWRSAA